MRNRKKVIKVLVAYLAYMVVTKKNKKKKKPRMRVNPYLAERNAKGRFATDFEDMRKIPTVFHENFHMTIDIFNEIFALVEPHLLPTRNLRPDAISPKQKLAVVLEYLASGSLQSQMASVYRISKSHLGTVIDQVCNAICLELHTCMPPLTKERFLDTAKGFANRWQFPNCIGAMDGKHVAITAPPRSGSVFYNYKGFHSIVLFAVADSKYRFTYFDIGAYGSEGDASIFANSSFGAALLNEQLDFPQNGEVNGESLPVYFLGDDAFPLAKRIMKPYGGKTLTEEELIFNYRLSRARRCVENAFGILCIKWLCLKRTMSCSPDRAQKIVTTCCLLHNFLLQKTSLYCNDSIDLEANLIEGAFSEQIVNIQDSSLIGNRLGAYSGRPYEVGKHIRDKVKTFVNSPEGAVEWQIDAALRRPVDECKSAQSKKSVDAGGDALATPQLEDCGDWEFAEALSFLPNLQRKRSTITSLQLGGTRTSHNSSQETSPCTSNYSYQRQLSDAGAAEAEGSSLQTSQMESQMEDNDDKLKFAAHYGLMDYILKKLPEEMAEDLIFDCIDKMRAALKANRNQ